MQNVSSLLGWVCSFWHTIQDFLETGFGFYLVHDDVIVSWCLTVYAAHGDVELGLATVPQYRNRGYATLTAAASLEQAVEEGLVPHWHCDEDNLASRRVAERVGFANPTHYAVYTFDL